MDLKKVDTYKKTLSIKKGVYLVGKIKKNIYKCITEDIITDEVIITDNQIKHIREKHLDAYEKIEENISNVIYNPDYILKDKHKNTGLIVKKIEFKKRYLQVVLKIATSEEKVHYKNSIISCWSISERRLQNYLRNKEILYKRE